MQVRKRVHLVGIGGDGMSALAKLYLEHGWEVSGSDQVSNEKTRALTALGITIFEGHRAEQIGEAAVVVHSPAVPRDNPELVAARASAAAILNRTRALTQLLAGREVVSVSGSHGKTTTTSMLALICDRAGRAAGYMVGGVSLALGGQNARRGEDGLFIAETCEAFRALDLWQPSHCLVTNVDDEHSDHYGGFNALRLAFSDMIDRVPVGGSICLCGDDPWLATAAAETGSHVLTFGTGPSNRVTAGSIELGPDGSSFELMVDGVGLGRVWLPVPGVHNLRNALGALAMAQSLAIPPQAAIAALAHFRPVQRRWQALGTVHGIRLFDDFAHHPAEIAATLALARQVAGAGRVHAVVQPQLVSRVTRLAEDYGPALGRADRVWLLPLQTAGEPGDAAAAETMLRDTLVRHAVQVTVVPNVAAAVEMVSGAAAEGDVIVWMGPTDASQFGLRLRDQLEALPKAPRSETNAALGPAVVAEQAPLMHDAFYRHVATMPDAPCAMTDDEVWSYGRMASEAERFAAALQQRGIGSGAIVVVYTRRSLHLPALLLGILKAGAAFCTIAPNMVRPDMGSVLNRAGAALTVTDNVERAKLCGLANPMTFTELLEHPAAAPVDITIRSSELAYAIFTSGSTGVPRLVGIEHGNVGSVIEQTLKAFYDPAEFRLVPTLASMSFDASIFQMFSTLSAGGTLLIIEDMIALLRSRHFGRVSMMGATPSMMRSFLDVAEIPASLQSLALAGEVTPDDLLARLRAVPTLRRIRNSYGPAEAAIFTTQSRPLDRDNPDGPPADGRTIGWPIPGTHLHLLGPDGKEVMDGMPGELVIVGPGVGRGYLGEPELTRERFGVDPCGGSARSYRTGDIVMRRADGAYVFLGRNDDQVKINGARIELGDVNASLGSCPGVQRSAVLAVTEADGVKRLAAFLVLDEKTDIAFVRQWLRLNASGLPAPHYIFALPALPLQVNGKVDRQALLAHWQAAKAETRFDNAGTRGGQDIGLETEVLSIWRRVLKQPRLTAHDAFLQMGGDSLLAMELILSVESHFGLRLKATDIDGLSTAAAMAKALAELRADNGGAPAQTDTADLADIVRKQQIYLAAWHGTRRRPDSPVLTLHQDAPGHGLFWVFQGNEEFTSLAEALGASFPLHGMRSGHLIMRYSPHTIAFLAELYADEMVALQPDGPLRIGGNCQGGVIARALALALRARGRVVSQLILMEQGKFWRYDEPVELIFGRESVLNPYNDGADPRTIFASSYPAGFRTHLIDGGHGEFFQPKNVPSLAAVVRSILRHDQG